MVLPFNAAFDILWTSIFQQLWKINQIIVIFYFLEALVYFFCLSFILTHLLSFPSTFHPRISSFFRLVFSFFSRNHWIFGLWIRPRSWSTELFSGDYQLNNTVDWFVSNPQFPCDYSIEAPVTSQVMFFYSCKFVLTCFFFSLVPRRYAKILMPCRYFLEVILGFSLNSSFYVGFSLIL